jgi:hypothetical protein
MVTAAQEQQLIKALESIAKSLEKITTQTGPANEEAAKS